MRMRVRRRGNPDPKGRETSWIFILEPPSYEVIYKTPRPSRTSKFGMLLLHHATSTKSSPWRSRPVHLLLFWPRQHPWRRHSTAVTAKLENLPRGLAPSPMCLRILLPEQGCNSLCLVFRGGGFLDAVELYRIRHARVVRVVGTPSFSPSSSRPAWFPQGLHPLV